MLILREEAAIFSAGVSGFLSEQVQQDCMQKLKNLVK
jgi:hypothetical protein